MGFFKPTVSKILITLCILFYPLAIGILQVIPLIADWHNTLIYPFWQLGNFLVSIFPDNLILELLALYVGQIVLYYFLSCCLVAIVTFLKQETPKTQTHRK